MVLKWSGQRKNYSLLSILRCRWLAILWRASLNSKCKPNLKSDVFFSTSSVISISILLPNTDCRYEKKNNAIIYLLKRETEKKRFWLVVVGPKIQTWFEALNSSMLFAFNNALTNTTMTAGLMKFVSTFNTRKVLFFWMASANSNAVRSVSPTLVNDKTSKCSFSVNALNNCSNFSSEIFYKGIVRLATEIYNLKETNKKDNLLWCYSNSIRSIWDHRPWLVWWIPRHLYCLVDRLGRFFVDLILWCHPIPNQLVGLCSAATHDIDLDSSLNGSQE